MSKACDPMQLKRINLLLVDDEERFRTTLGKRLAEKGINARTAAGGPEALNLIRESPADVVILDIKMPEMDGIETLQQIKKADSDIEVILLTGHAEVESAVEGMKLGAYDYLIKPCDYEKLLETVCRAFEHRIAREENRIKDKVKREMDHWQRHWSRS